MLSSNDQEAVQEAVDMLEESAKVAADSNIAIHTARLCRNYYDELLRQHFTPEQAIAITIGVLQK